MTQNLTHVHPSAIAGGDNNQTMKVLVALAVVYIVWGSTYLAMYIALESFPPVILSALRFWAAGFVMLGIALWRKEQFPSLRLTANAVLIGCLTMGAGTTSVAIAEQSVSTGLTAMAIAAVPLWAGVFAALLMKQPSRMEWIGMIIGFGGIVLLNLEDSLQADPVAAFVLILGPVSWSFGSILSRRLKLPSGAMALAVEMIGAAAVLSVLALFMGEEITATPTTNAILAIIYLAVFGSMMGFTAYMYLLQTVRPAMATSYAYINPIVAVLLGVLFAGESFSLLAMVAMGVILTGVIIVVRARARA